MIEYLILLILGVAQLRHAIRVYGRRQDDNLI